MFVGKIQKGGIDIYIVTGDFYQDFHGAAVELFRKRVPKILGDVFYTCYIETMIAMIISLALDNLFPVEASPERYVKCSLGLCDSGAIDGLYVCKEGIVFN